MTRETQELLRTVEQLPEARRAEVVDFARFLLERDRNAGPTRQAVDKWLDSAEGAGIAGVTTDQVMQLTRGEA